jgi:hypothetical protein
MELIPEAIRARLLANGAKVREEDDHVPLVKLFTPDANATWLISESDPDRPDLYFALCDLGFGFPELGYLSISEISSVKGPLGLSIERDLWFKGDFPLSVYAHAARGVGHITLERDALAAAARELEQRNSMLERKYSAA